MVGASMIGKKPRKPRAPKEKPPGMSNAAWIAEEARLKQENLQRRTREKAQRQRELSAHLAAEAEAQASIQACLADAKANAGKREDITAKRWSALMANSKVKIELLRTGTVAKKRNHDLAFLTGADPDAMDPELRTWYMAQRRLILSDISTAPSDTTYDTPTDNTYGTPTETSSRDTACPASVHGADRPGRRRHCCPELCAGSDHHADRPGRRRHCCAVAGLYLICASAERRMWPWIARLWLDRDYLIAQLWRFL